MQLIRDDLKKRACPQRKIEPKRFLVLSFLLPVLFMGIGLILQSVHPFGDRQIMVTDFWHQYYPFLRLLHEKLQNGGSLLYTWDSGLGSNFIAMMAYYTASPLNLLTVLVPDQWLREAVTVILLFKIGFAGFFFALFLKGTFRRNDFSICLFSLMYALCSYILGYYWNIIWLDTVALLPLVILGLVYLMRDGKCRLYIAALGLSLVTNYYIGMFTCIFSVIAFLCLLAFYVPPRQIPGRIGAMAISSLLGGTLAAAVILPAFFALQLTHSVNNTFPDQMEFYESWRAILANLISFHTPTVKEGLPNLACGILPLVLFGPFLRSGSIRIREKIAAVLTLVFLLVSCNWNMLNFIWHGFHVPNMLPYRFAFLFSFVLLTMAYRAFQLVLEEKQTIWDIMAMLVTGIAVFLLAYSVQDTHAVCYTLAVAVLYIVVLLLYFRKLFDRKWMYTALSAVLAFELFQNVQSATEEVGTSDYGSYPAQSASVSAMLEKMDAQEESLFYRTELASWYSLNDPALYGYHGLSQFSSMANENVTVWMRSLGLPAQEIGNRYYYVGGSPVTNMFTGIQYLISRNEPVQDSYGWEMIHTEDRVYGYRNLFPLPVGFVTESTLAEYECDPEGNPFENQNKLFQLATGIDTPLFTPVEVDSVMHTGVTVMSNGYGNYYYHTDGEYDTQKLLQYFYRYPHKGVLYGYMDVTGGASISVTKDEGLAKTYAYSKQPYIFPLGTVSGVEKVHISASLSQDASSGNVTVYAYAMNTDVLEQGYAKLAAGAVTVTSWKDTKLECTVQTDAEGLCYFSIPYEEGWSAKIDGNPVQLQSVGNAMIALPLQAGEHTIKLSYCPKGFVVGALLSGGTLLLLICSLFVKRQLLQPVPIKEMQQEASKEASAEEETEEEAQSE